MQYRCEIVAENEDILHLLLYVRVWYEYRFTYSSVTSNGYRSKWDVVGGMRLTMCNILLRAKEYRVRSILTGEKNYVCIPNQYSEKIKTFAGTNKMLVL